MFKHLGIADCKLLLGDARPIVIDIRDSQSFELGHIPNARNINNGNIQNFIAEADQEVPVIVCCYHGNASQSAAAYLCEQGFEDVYSLDGGFEGWRQQYEFCSI